LARVNKSGKKLICCFFSIRWYARLSSV